uniref:Uncharacterized protein n=1 Tax=Ditylum brightwellii TaxID=49249 RepID=A0A7S4VSH5_9STRA
MVIATLFICLGDVREGRICHLAELSGCDVSIRMLDNMYDDSCDIITVVQYNVLVCRFHCRDDIVSSLGVSGALILEQVPVAARQVRGSKIDVYRRINLVLISMNCRLTHLLWFLYTCYIAIIFLMCNKY